MIVQSKIISKLYDVFEFLNKKIITKNIKLKII